MELPSFCMKWRGATWHQNLRVFCPVFQDGPCMKWCWFFHFIRGMGSSIPYRYSQGGSDTILLLNMHLDRMHNKKLQLASSQQVRAKPNQCHETGSPFIVPVAVMRLIQDALMERALNNFARKQGWKGRPKDPTNGATQSEWAAGVPKSVNPRHQAKVHGDWLPLAPA